MLQFSQRSIIFSISPMVSLLGLIFIASFVAGNIEDGGDDDFVEELVLRPLGDSHVRPLSGTIMFGCEVSNGDDVTGQYHIKWFNEDNREIADTSGRMYVEDDSPILKKMYITRIDNSDAGTYTCTAVINGVEHKKSTSLKLYKGITFDNAPTLQTPKIYTDALIECAVSGEPVPQVSWRYGGKRIKFKADGRYSMDPDGKGIIVKNITKEDDGEYICRAEVNSDGRYKEEKITVNVHIPPAITKSSGNVQGTEGESASIACTATGLPMPKYEFIKAQEGAPVPLQSSDSITVDADGGTVVFGSLKKSDEGQYTCKALNDAGEDTAINHLHVLVKPVITELLNVTETEGETAMLTCKSKGDPQPNMTFQKSGLPAVFTSENEDDRIIATQSNNVLTLIIRELQPSDTGIYTCKSFSDIGEDESEASITVHYAPRFKTTAMEFYTWAGRTSNITCHADGSPTPTFHWFKDNMELLNNDTFHIFTINTTSYLQMKVREVDQTWIYNQYECRAENSIDSDEMIIDVKRATTPGSPFEVNTTRVSPTSVDLKVEEPEDDGGMPIIGYVVEYGKDVTEFTADQPLHLVNLKPNTTYTVTVKAKNEVGAGSSIDFTFTTEPTREPDAIEIQSDSAGSRPYEYVISWNTPDTGGLPIIEYKFKFRPVKMVKRNQTEQVEALQPDWTEMTKQDNEQSPMVQLRLNDLKARTSYELVVQARNKMGWSLEHQPFVFTTSEDPYATTTLPTTVESNLFANINENQLAEPSEKKSASVSVGTVVIIVAVVLGVILVIIDISCYCVNGCGVTALLCGKKKKTDHSPSKAEKAEGEKMLKNDKTTSADRKIEEIQLNDKR